MRPSLTKFQGFTLVEIMIVVAIIAIILVIIVPATIKMQINAQRSACIGNLRQIYVAKAIWSMTHGKYSGIPVDMSDLVTAYIKTTPSCPAGGNYVVGPVGDLPTCDKPGHNIND